MQNFFSFLFCIQDEMAIPPARGMHESEVIKKIRRRLREIAKTNGTGE
jgi:hypothetical protein